MQPHEATRVCKDMRRLFVVGLSCAALACGDATTDDGRADATGSEGPADPSTSGGMVSSSTSSATNPATTGGSASGSDDTFATTDADPSSSDGSTGVGPGDSGSDESGPALPRGQWAVTEITYSGGGESETLSMQDRTFCDATLTPDGLQLRYQQAGGYTVWLVTIPNATPLGSTPLSQDFSGVFMNINEVGETWQAYFDPSTAFGSLELTEADLQSSGTVAGVLTATLTSGDGSITADFSSTFYAEIP